MYTIIEPTLDDGITIIDVHVRTQQSEGTFIVWDIQLVTYTEWIEFTKCGAAIMRVGTCYMAKSDGKITFCVNGSTYSCAMTYPLGNFEDALQKSIERLHSRGLLRE